MVQKREFNQLWYCCCCCHYYRVAERNKRSCDDILNSLFASKHVNHWSPIVQVIFLHDNQGQPCRLQSGFQLTMTEKAGVVLGVASANAFTAFKEVAVQQDAVGPKQGHQRRNERPMNEAAHVNKVKRALTEGQAAPRVHHAHTRVVAQTVVRGKVVTTSSKMKAVIEANGCPAARREVGEIAAGAGANVQCHTRNQRADMALQKRVWRPAESFGWNTTCAVDLGRGYNSEGVIAGLPKVPLHLLPLRPTQVGDETQIDVPRRQLRAVALYSGPRKRKGAAHVACIVLRRLAEVQRNDAT